MYSPNVLNQLAKDKHFRLGRFCPLFCRAESPWGGGGLDPVPPTGGMKMSGWKQPGMFLSG